MQAPETESYFEVFYLTVWGGSDEPPSHTFTAPREGFQRRRPRRRAAESPLAPLLSMCSKTQVYRYTAHERAEDAPCVNRDPAASHEGNAFVQQLHT